MEQKSKKASKVCKIAKVCTVGALIGLSYIGLGVMFQEQYHDPENYMHTILQNARYGWSVKTHDGWAA